MQILQCWSKKSVRSAQSIHLTAGARLSRLYARLSRDFEYNESPVLIDCAAAAQNSRYLIRELRIASRKLLVDHNVFQVVPLEFSHIILLEINKIIEVRVVARWQVATVAIKDIFVVVASPQHLLRQFKRNAFGTWVVPIGRE